MLSKIITQKLQKLETIEQRIKTEQSTKTQLRNSTERVINKNKAIISTFFMVINCFETQKRNKNRSYPHKW